jgi:3-deoxy-D-manno-octulosonic-acid transferase
VLEPAVAGAAVVTGPHTHNFQAIMNLMEQADAVIKLPAVEGKDATRELTNVLSRLLADAGERARLGLRAKQLVAENQGAAERTLKLVAPLLSAKQHESSRSDSMLAANAHTS